MSGDRLDTAELVECGKNKCQLTCLRCQSKILPPGMGSYEVSLVSRVIIKTKDF